MTSPLFGWGISSGDKTASPEVFGKGQALAIAQQGEMNPVPVPFNFSKDLAAGLGDTLTVGGVGNQRVYVIMYEVFVTVASPSTDVTITMQSSSGVERYEAIIPAGAPVGYRIGWIRDAKPLPMEVGDDYKLVISAPGGSCILHVNNDGYVQ